MSVTHGMDVGEVRRLGGSLQSKADQLDALIKDVDRSVGGSSWVGPDATMFKTQWWPERKAQLLRASQDLHGLGQSALNNAGEQDRASDVSPGGEGSAGVVPNEGAVDGGSTAGGESGGSSDSNAASGGTAGVPGATSGELPNSNRTWQQVQKTYEADSVRMGLGDKAFNGENRYQCTAWAHYRWRELAEERGIDIGTIQSGNGGVLAGNNGGSAEADPTLGAMVSRPNQNHVMVVEEIDTAPDGSTRIRVSEMNALGEGKVTDAKGHVVDHGLPKEYRDTDWYVEDSNGRWVRERGSVGVGELVFADFPSGS